MDDEADDDVGTEWDGAPRATDAAIRHNGVWFTGFCRSCGYPVAVASACMAQGHGDYAWYCSNKRCERHATMTETYDMACPDWVVVPSCTEQSVNKDWYRRVHSAIVALDVAREKNGDTATCERALVAACMERP